LGDKAADVALARFRAHSALDERNGYRPMLLVREILRKEKIVTDRESGVTYRYNGKVWRPVLPEDLERLAAGTLLNAARGSNTREAAGLLRAATLLPEGEGMNCSPGMVCCANGMAELGTWELHPHAPEHRATYMLDWDFTPHDPPPCPRWLRYLAELDLDPGVIRELQQFVGYLLWPHSPFKKALFIVGLGDTGKSKFLNVLEALVGEENCAALDMEDLTDKFMRAQLKDKMLNVYHEADVKFFESRLFKALTGGDRITASFKHLKPFEMRFNGVMAFSMNRFPRVADDNEAFWNRIFPVRFHRTFKGAAADTGLMHKLLAELPGIFHWALVGLAELLEADGFRHCQATRDTLEQCRRDTNPIMNFMEECCLVGADEYGEPYWMAKDALYSAYQSWAKSNGFGTTNRNNFLSALRQLHPDLEDYRPRVGDRRIYALKGIQVRDTTDMAA
jgi:putative DNA primase/helicase